MKKLASIFLCLLGLGIHHTRGQDSLSIIDFFNAVGEFHPLIRQAKNLPLMAQEEKRLARGAFDPKIEGQLDEKKYKGKKYYTITDISTKIPTWVGVDLKMGYQYNEGYYLNPEDQLPKEGLFYAGISVPLMRGLLMDERRTLLLQAKNLITLSEAEQQKAIAKLHYEIASDYWAWYAAHQIYEVSQKGVEIAKNRFEGVKEAFWGGKYAAIDTTEALMEYQRRLTELQKAELTLQNAVLELSLHLWNENNEPVLLKEGIFPIQKGIKEPSMDSIKLYASEKHPEIQKNIIKTKNYQIEEKLWKYSLMPQIQLEYKPLLYPQGSGTWSENYKLGISLYSPLFMRKERAKLALTRIKINSQQFETEYARRSVITKIEQAQNKVNAYRQMLANQEKNAQAALQLRDAEEEKFSLGSSNLFLINYRERYYMENLIKLYEIKALFEEAKSYLLYSAGMLMNTNE